MSRSFIYVLATFRYEDTGRLFTQVNRSPWLVTISDHLPSKIYSKNCVSHQKVLSVFGLVYNPYPDISSPKIYLIRPRKSFPKSSNPVVGSYVVFITCFSLHWYSKKCAVESILINGLFNAKTDFFKKSLDSNWGFPVRQLVKQIDNSVIASSAEPFLLHLVPRAAFEPLTFLLGGKRLPLSHYRSPFFFNGGTMLLFNSMYF